jgi:hypothetical protein
MYLPADGKVKSGDTNVKERTAYKLICFQCLSSILILLQVCYCINSGSGWVALIAMQYIDAIVYLYECMV